MSERIRVDWEQMEDVAVQLKQLSDLLYSVNNRIRSVRINQRSGADLELSFPAGRLASTGASVGSGTVEECLQSLAAGVSALNEHAASLAGRLGQAADLFVANENRLLRSVESVLTPEEIMSRIAGSMGFGTDPSLWTPEMRSLLQKKLEGAQLLHDEGITCLIKNGEALLMDDSGMIAQTTWTLGLSGMEITNELLVNNQKLKGELDIGLIDGITYKDKPVKAPEWFSQKKTYDPKTGKYAKDDTPSGKTIGLISVGAAASASYNAFVQSAALQNDHFGMELTSSVGNAEIDASFKGGLGVYVDPSGKKYLQVGLEAKSGASVSVAKVESSMTYELCDQISVGVDSDITVLSAEQKSELSIGIMDGKVVAYAEGSAELNLLEANVEGNFDTDLIDGKLGGSLKVGIGMHGKVGYKDGLIVFDVGGSLGIGASVNGEINISGLVDAAEDVGQSIAEGVDSVIDGVGSVVKGVGSVVESVGSVVESVGSACAWLIG